MNGAQEDGPFAEDSRVELTDLPEQESGAKQSGEGGFSPKTPARRSFSRLQAFLFEFPRRRRGLEAMAIIGLAMLLLALLLGSSSDLRTSLVTGIFGHAPIPTATLPPGLDYIYVSGSPPWGKLTIDGQPIAHLPELGGPPFHLSQGQHYLTWRADPFLPQSCVISVPPDAVHDTCQRQAAEPQLETSPQLVSFQADISMLPVIQQKALVALVQATLNTLQGTDIAYPGEQIAAVGIPPLQKIAQPLRATFRLQLDTTSQDSSCIFGQDRASISSCFLNGQDCHLLCTDGAPRTSLVDVPYWRVIGVARSLWTYTTLGGKVLAGNEPDGFGGTSGLEHLIPLTITWDGAQWHIVARGEFINGPISCASAQDDAAINGELPQQVNLRTYITDADTWQYLSGANTAQGCLVAIPLQPAGANPAMPVPLRRTNTALFMYRFNTYLAVNKLAQNYAPDWPRPDAYELGIARQLAAQIRVSF